jgi:hypothetical protein
LGESLEPVRTNNQFVLVWLTRLGVHDVTPRRAIDDRFVGIDEDIDARLPGSGRSVRNAGDRSPVLIDAASRSDSTRQERHVALSAVECGKHGCDRAGRVSGNEKEGD